LKHEVSGALGDHQCGRVRVPGYDIDLVEPIVFDLVIRDHFVGELAG
jgi:hypothetical protein